MGVNRGAILLAKITSLVTQKELKFTLQDSYFFSLGYPCPPLMEGEQPPLLMTPNLDAACLNIFSTSSFNVLKNFDFCVHNVSLLFPKVM